MSIFKLPNWALPIAQSKWNTVVVWLLRAAVGCVFIFSGLVKGIDPWGGYYKLIDYFNAFGFPELVQVALPCALALACFEFVLGVCVLVGAFRRGSVALLLLMMCVMTPLTLDLALTGKVPDCGCFGDALVLSNWHTFVKNLILLPALVYLQCFNRRVHGLYGPAINWAVGLFALVYIAVVAYDGYNVQPLIDFRPYKVGARVGVSSTADTDGDDYVFVYEKDGKQQAFGLDSLPDDDSGWQYVQRRFKPGREPRGQASHPSIEILDNGNDVTDLVLPDTGRQLLILFPDLKNVNIAYTFDINVISENAKKQGVAMMGLTAADTAAVAEWYDISMARYPIYNVDESQLKTIARGNPALVYVENGTVRWKRTLTSLNPDYVRNGQFPIARYNSDYDASGQLKGLTGALVIAMLALLLINRTHVVVLAMCRRFRSQRSPRADAAQASDKEL